MTHYAPKDAFSKELLFSIPKKVTAWLENMNQPEKGEHGNIKWDYTPDCGIITYTDSLRHDEIVWSVENESIVVNDMRGEDLTTNLLYLTTLERLIYGEVEKIQNELFEHESPIQILRENIAKYTEHLQVPKDTTPPEPIILNAQARIAQENINAAISRGMGSVIDD